MEKLFRCLITKVYLEGLDKDAKGISKVEGKFAVENFEDKKEVWRLFLISKSEGEERDPVVIVFRPVLTLPPSVLRPLRMFEMTGAGAVLCEPGWI